MNFIYSKDNRFDPINRMCSAARSMRGVTAVRLASKRRDEILAPMRPAAKTSAWIMGVERGTPSSSRQAKDGYIGEQAAMMTALMTSTAS